MAKFEQGQKVEYTKPDGDTETVTVFLHSGTVVAVEKENGDRRMVHQSKLESN
jgi:hypothetical protein